MATAYVGEIRLFAGNFAPSGWAMCQGQLMPIANNEALFSLIGTTYGGNGQTTFALPDLRSRIPVHQGASPGGTYVMGQQGGEEQVTLALSQIPQHNHAANALSAAGNQQGPGGGFWAYPTWVSSPHLPRTRPWARRPSPQPDRVRHTTISCPTWRSTSSSPSLGSSRRVTDGDGRAIRNVRPGGCQPFVRRIVDVHSLSRSDLNDVVQLRTKGWASCNGQVLSITQNQRALRTTGHHIRG